MGVWIEMPHWSMYLKHFPVTPLVGVWIEILSWQHTKPARTVTPLVGVWIEIWHIFVMIVSDRCHSPCGSVDWNMKHICDDCIWPMSLPLWECGLKYLQFLRTHIWWQCHSPCGSVDWNWLLLEIIFCGVRHSPCGSVDWNLPYMILQWGYLVTPLVGVWIEIFLSLQLADRELSLPLWECGLKFEYFVGNFFKYRHSPCGSVDWNTQHRKSMSAVVRHSPCGSVDWNKFDVTLCKNLYLSLPLWECGLK